jgi:hypothetical protein
MLREMGAELLSGNGATAVNFECENLVMFGEK